MQFDIKCPICNAKNKLTKKETICRRCKEDLIKLYELKEAKIKNTIVKILKS